eukprot:3234618-Heterocapsa_arctica.AAC.1
MAVRKSKVKQWAMKLNDGRFSSPETLVWEIDARGELAKIRGNISLRRILISASVMKEWITESLRPLRLRRDATAPLLLSPLTCIELPESFKFTNPTLNRWRPTEVSWPDVDMQYIRLRP